MSDSVPECCTMSEGVTVHCAVSDSATDCCTTYNGVTVFVQCIVTDVAQCPTVILSVVQSVTVTVLYDL